MHMFVYMYVYTELPLMVVVDYQTQLFTISQIFAFSVCFYQIVDQIN